VPAYLSIAERQGHRASGDGQGDRDAPMRSSEPSAKAIAVVAKAVAVEMGVV
jgi:hypothetical protein